jgi:hypothetical protein
VLDTKSPKYLEMAQGHISLSDPSDRKGKRVKITDQIEEKEEDEDSDDNTTDPSAGDYCKYNEQMSIVK